MKVYMFLDQLRGAEEKREETAFSLYGPPFLSLLGYTYAGEEDHPGDGVIVPLGDEDDSGYRIADFLDPRVHGVSFVCNEVKQRLLEKMRDCPLSYVSILVYGLWGCIKDEKGTTLPDPVLFYYDHASGIRVFDAWHKMLGD